MRCPSCANDIAESSRFCPACGASLESRSETPTRSFLQVGAQEAQAAGRARRPFHSTDASGAHVTSAPGQERFAPGTLLAGRYRIIGLLGRGGMGEVYRADDLKLGRPVALKFLPQGLEADPGRLGRFVNEVRLALRVTHPNVCRVHDIGETDGQHFLSMEYVDGEDLGSLLRRIGRFPRDRAIRVTRQLCGGLAAAHEQGILHRDLKPGNVMIDGRGQVKITDFGLAGIAEELKGPQVRVGTPGYMSPEQTEGREVTVRSDVFSLGLVLYEVFTGQPAFETGAAVRRPGGAARQRGAEGGQAESRRQTAPTSPASLVEGLDPAIEGVILRCLETDPARRPASALAVLAALPGGDPIGAALAAGETPSPELLAEAGQAGGLRPALAWGALAVVLIGLGLVVLIGDNVQLVGLARLDKPPEALADRAREIVRSLGYQEQPADSLSGFDANDAYLHHLEKAGSGIGAGAPFGRSRPGALLFRYRQSPRTLVRFGTGALGDWFVDPPDTVPGMLQVALAPDGRLQSFGAVPPERDESATRETGNPARAPDWTPLLAAAGLEPAALKNATPSWAPPVFADRRVAWEGVYPEASDVPIHVEAAASGGRPVWFRIIEPWTEPAVGAGEPQSAAGHVSETISTVVFVIVLICASFIAVRNARLGRGDRQTALRFALYLGSARLLWLLGAHHVSGGHEVILFISHLAFAMQRFALVWLFYMTLEPYARRLWPRMLVSWVRLFGGRLRDPLVGRDLLVGALFGVGSAILQLLARWLPGRLGLAPFPPLAGQMWSIEALGGLRNAVTATLAVHTVSMMEPFFPIMLFLVLRLLLRRTWPGVVIVSLAGLALFYPGTGSIAAWVVIISPMMVLFWILLFRVGLLSVIVGMSTADLLTQVPVTFDFASWRAGAGLPTLLVILGMTLWAFRTSVAGRPLFRDEVLGAEVAARHAR